MRYDNNDIIASREMLIAFPSELSVMDMLSRIDQIKSTGRYSEVFMDASLNGIVGVIQ